MDEGACGMYFNAFVGGVQPGGLTNDFEVKLLVCYLLDSLKPVSYTHLDVYKRQFGSCANLICPTCRGISHSAMMRTNPAAISG